MSSNKMHCLTTSLILKLLTGKAKTYKELHHFMDQPSKYLGTRHRIFYHNILFHPLAFAILSKNNKAEIFIATATHILQDQVSSALKHGRHGRRKHRK